jgi:hypothetical protein
MSSTVHNVNISKRTIYVAAHNTWRNLSTNESIIPLEEPDSRGICRGTSSIEIQRYIEDPLVALTFRVEYKAMLPVNPRPREVTFTVAW